MLSSLIGVRQIVNYEAQAAIELEVVADTSEMDNYPIIIPDMSSNGAQAIDIEEMLEEILKDVNNKTPASVISARFHNSLAVMAKKACVNIRKGYGIKSVILSGGVWQNINLLRRTCSELLSSEFQVYIHRKVPTNDSGIALGQAVIANHRLSNL